MTHITTQCHAADPSRTANQMDATGDNLKYVAAIEFALSKIARGDKPEILYVVNNLMSTSMLNSPDIMRKFVSQHFELVDYIPAELFGNLQFLASIVLQELDKSCNRGETLLCDYILKRSPKLSGDKDFATTLLTVWGDSLRYFSDEIRNDREIVVAAVNSEHSKSALSFASYRQRGHPWVVLNAVQKNPDALFWATDEMKDSPQIVRAAVSHKGQSIQFASLRLKNDFIIVSLAVSNQHVVSKRYPGIEFTNCLCLLPDLMRNHKDIVLKSIKKTVTSFFFIDDNLKMDFDVAWTAITHDRSTECFQALPKEMQKTLSHYAVREGMTCSLPKATQDLVTAICPNDSPSPPSTPSTKRPRSPAP